MPKYKIIKTDLILNYATESNDEFSLSGAIAIIKYDVYETGDVKLTDKDITYLHEKHHLIVNSIKKGYEIVEAN